jgi:hypothetical protein
MVSVGKAKRELNWVANGTDLTSVSARTRSVALQGGIPKHVSGDGVSALDALSASTCSMQSVFATNRGGDESHEKLSARMDGT